MTSPVRQRNYSEMSVTAFSVWSFEFVAKPEEAANAVLYLPAAIQSGLEDFSGLAGSLGNGLRLGCSLDHRDHFLAGSEARRSCTQSVRRLRALLAHRPTAEVLLNRSSSIDRNFIASDSIAQEANVCVA